MTHPGNPILLLPSGTLLVILLLLVGCFWLSVTSLRQMLRALESRPDGMLPLIGDERSNRSPLHTWDPRFRIVGIVGYIFFVVTLHEPATVGLALLLAVVVTGVGRLSWKSTLRRILAMNGFLAMFLVVMPITAVIRPSDTLVVFTPLPDWPVNLRGIELALVLIGKAWTVALMMESLFATAPLGTTIAGLSRLGLPSKAGELLLITHRYIHVFFGELQRMRSGMDARAFRPSHRFATLRDSGNFVGMLLVRSFERTHRVYDAMLARGYDGTMPSHTAFRGRPEDWIKAAVFLGSGALLLVWDRLPGGGF